jgi:hypothetical protein
MKEGDLSLLLERVEGASGPDRELDGHLYGALGYQIIQRFGGFEWRPEGKGVWQTMPSPTASLDAALALCERVLPTAYRDLGEGFDTKAQRRFWLATLTYHEKTGSHDAEAPTAPLALLAALLKAKASQHE